MSKMHSQYVEKALDEATLAVNFPTRYDREHPEHRPVHAQAAGAYATLALVEQVRELTEEVRALRVEAAKPAPRRWWNRRRDVRDQRSEVTR